MTLPISFCTRPYALRNCSARSCISVAIFAALYLQRTTHYKLRLLLFALLPDSLLGFQETAGVVGSLLLRFRRDLWLGSRFGSECPWTGRRLIGAPRSDGNLLSGIEAARGTKLIERLAHLQFATLQ